MLESFFGMANRGSLIMVLTASAAAIIQESQSSTALNYRFLSRETPNFVIVPFSLANPQFEVLHKGLSVCIKINFPDGFGGSTPFS